MACSYTPYQDGARCATRVLEVLIGGFYEEVAKVPLLELVGVVINHEPEFAQHPRSPRTLHTIANCRSALSDCPSPAAWKYALAFGNPAAFAMPWKRGDIHASVLVEIFECGNGQAVAEAWNRIEEASESSLQLTILCLSHGSLPIVKACWRSLDMDVSAWDAHLNLNAAVIRALADSNADARVSPWVADKLSADEKTAAGRPCRWATTHGLFHPARDRHI